ncbi:MAG: hypothetical protein AAGI09_13505 [Pseudomonadota bacterium]
MIEHSIGSIGTELRAENTALRRQIRLLRIALEAANYEVDTLRQGRGLSPTRPAQPAIMPPSAQRGG